MRFQAALLRSRVGRRLLLAFLGSALLPLAILALLAFAEISEELYAQSDRRLHQASKATALAIVGRLQSLEADLDGLAALQRAGDAAGARRAAAAMDSHLAWVALETSGRCTALLGACPELPAAPPGAAGHLAAGRTAVHVARGPSGDARVVIRRRVDPRAEATLAAEARQDFLFDVSPETTLPPLGEYCLLDDRLRVVRCSWPGSPELPRRVAAQMESQTAGAFEWEHGGTRHLARFWSLFLGPQFHVRDWTLVVAEPRDEVLAPVAGFRAMFPAAMLACFLVTGLIALRQIRRRLEPLDELRAGTERVARGDFGVELHVESGDEFEVVARSFNTMAQRLSQQFDRLARLIEVDRSILAAGEVADLGAAILAGVRSLVPCQAVALQIAPPDRPDTHLEFVWRAGREAPEVFEGPPPDAVAAQLLLEAPEGRLTEVGGDAPPHLARLRGASVRTALALPIAVEGRLRGILACGHGEGGEPDAETRTLVRRLADQAALALAKAYAREERRVLAYYDALTRLPNRLLFRERVEQALAQARRRRTQLAICLLDLDGFKNVNETLGLAAGDELIRAVAERLQWELGAGRVARLGGDEFGILVDEITHVDAPARVAEQVVGALSLPFSVAGREVFTSASVGIAVHPDDGDDLETLLRNADTAMYHVKSQRSGGFRFFTGSMHSQALERLQLEADLRRAVDREEFELVYQPVVDAATRQIVSAEALLRWKHEARGQVLPGEFIPVAEEVGLISAIGEWVVRRACAQLRAWQEAGLPHLSVAVNVSGRQFTGGDVLRAVRRALSESGVYPHYLTLEVTETSMMRSRGESREALEALRALGVRIAIDDFGTGYSSLAYLKQFPFDHLKVDQSFVADVVHDPDAAAIVRAIIALARGLKLRVVAEGVETESQLAFLREHGCEWAQGRLFFEPLPADAFEKLLASLDGELGPVR